MKFLFSVISILLISSAFSLTYLEKNAVLEKLIDQPKELFKAYYSLYNKDAEYDINSEVGLKKYKVFRDNVKEITEDNLKAGVHIYSINKFTDLTQEEFASKYLMKPEIVSLHMNKYGKSNDNIKPVSVGAGPWEEVDWRPFLNPVRDQGVCGSCWSFAATAAVEGGYNILKSPSLYAFSEQYLIDCDDLDNGCSGGWPTNTFTWLKNNGVVNANEVPYQGKITSCVSTNIKKAFNLVKDFKYCEKDCAEDKWRELISKGPIVVGMDANDSKLKSYGPKVDGLNTAYVPGLKQCVKTNHAVTAVGIFNKNTNEPHIIVRNSWGADWGVEGYFSIPAYNSCFITSNAWLPEVREEHENFSEPATNSKLFKSCDEKEEGFSFAQGVPDFKAISGEPIRGYIAGLNASSYTLYSEPDCKGQTRSSSSAYNFRCFAVNKLWLLREFRSVYVKPGSSKNGCVFLYSQSCYAGEWARICENISDLSTVNFDFKNIKSIRISGVFGMKGSVRSLFLFNNTNFIGEGMAVELTKDLYLNDEKLGDLSKALLNAKSLFLGISK